MSTLGTVLLYLLTILTTLAGTMAVVGVRRKSRAMLHSARLTTYAAALAATAAIATLAYAFAISDFSLAYVQQHSDRTMNLFYRVTSTWGGLEGSLLLWAWLHAVFTALAVRSNWQRLQESIPYVILVQMFVLLFFCVILVTQSNPFDVFLMGTPLAGKGLNPLLQNPYMVTHPPALYLGFTGMSIPFAFAMASLLSGQTDDIWLQAVRPWTMAAWYFLSLGLVLGMLWAYEELGWGGYWGWDPVENAGFLPWLTGTAFLHSIMVQERRQMLKKWNVILALITFVLTIFGTFLTRSGFIDSVHAFAKSNIGWVFLAFIALTLVFGFALIAWRSDSLRSRGHLESVLSREFAFLLNNWVLLSWALLVMVLTIFPNISALFGDKITISIPAFNRWTVPLGIALLILTGFGPMLAWRKTSSSGLLRQFLWPLTLGAATMIGLLLGTSYPFGLATFTWALCAFTTTTMLQEIIRGVRIRRATTNVGLGTAISQLFARNRRRYGGYVIHFGVVLMFVGFGGEAFKIEKEVLMKRGQVMDVGRYTVRMDDIKSDIDDQKTIVVADMTVFEGKNELGKIHPARWTFFRHENMPTTEVALRRTFQEDLFIALGEHDVKQGAAQFKLVVNPLVNWIWIGFLILTFGTIIAMIPSGSRQARPKPAKIAALLVLLLASPAFAAGDSANTTKTGAATAALEHPETGTVLMTDAERDLFAKIVCLCGSCPKRLMSTCECGFAERERGAIRTKVAAGWDEKRILQWYMDERGQEIGMSRFGAGALSVPPDTPLNRMAWLAPYLLSGIAMFLLLFVGRRWVRTQGSTTTAAAAAAKAAGSTPAATNSEDPYAKLLDDELEKLDN